jgi:hypothetical protein
LTVVRLAARDRSQLPDVISSDNLDELGLPRQIDTSSELEAQSLSPGVVTGTAQVILNPCDATDLGDDTVLCCEVDMADHEYHPLNIIPGFPRVFLPPWIVGYLIIVLPLSFLLKPMLRVY